jgi:hypothetical protein
MQARGLGPDKGQEEMTIVSRQIVVIIKDLGCRLDRGQSVQQVLLGWFR